MEDHFQSDEAAEEADLEEQGGFDQGSADALLSGVGEVAYPPCAGAGEGGDDGVETDEGRDDAAGVDGGMVGDVEEGAAEDEVIRGGVDRAGKEGQQVLIYCGSIRRMGMLGEKASR